MKINHLWFENLIIPPKWRTLRKVSIRNAILWQEGLGPEPLDSSGIGLEGFRWPLWRASAVLSLSVALFLFLFSRVFALQVIQGAEYRRKSEENRLRFQVAQAPRGIIYDRNGKVLAKNLPGFRIIWDPTVVPEGTTGRRTLMEESGEPNWGKMSQLLNLPLDELRRKIEEAKSRGTPVVLKSPASRDEVVSVETTFSNFPSVKTEISPLRHYPYGKLFAHTLGYVGEADTGDAVTGLVGKSGLEKEFDLLLRGKPGKKLLEVNVLGEGEREVAAREPVAGLPLWTSLDLELQKVSYEALSWGIKRSGATGGVVVAQNPQTGELLALLSLPSFDPNQFVSGMSKSAFGKISADPRKPLFDRAIAGSYPPGSVFKLVTATGALEEGVIGPKTIIDCPGAISVGSFVYRDWKPEGLGKISLVDAIGKSSDVFFYTVGGGRGTIKGLGAERLAHWARLFGFGQLLGIDQPGEAAGLVPDPEWKRREKRESWYLGNTYHMAIGQGDLLVTPLQINTMVTAIANGGKLLRPTLILGHGPEIIRENFASPATLDWVKEGMKAACRPGGTAYPLFTFPIAIGGKTGTAETGTGKATHAWFSGFAPFDHPQIVLTVFLEGGGEGSHDAAPVARKILDWYLEHRLLNH